MAQHDNYPKLNDFIRRHLLLGIDGEFDMDAACDDWVDACVFHRADALARPPPSIPSPERGPRKRDRETGRTDYWQTDWGTLIRHRNVSDINTKQGRRFRRRFRVPFPVFRDTLMPKVIEHKIFQNSPTTRIPPEFKVMACLRLLARGLVYDDVAELSHIAESTIGTIYHQFINGITETASFLVIASHDNEILYVSNAYFGTYNDKMVFAEDDFCASLRNGLLDEITFSCFNKKHQFLRCKGGFFIVDGGYPTWAFLLCADNRRYDRPYVLFREWLESVRKDVECTFGHLKMRFLILKNGVITHRVIDCEKTFKTCCVLHNMILRYSDELASWENVDWSGLEPEEDVDEDSIGMKFSIVRELAKL